MRWAMLESANNIQNDDSVTDIKSDLTENCNSKFSNLRLLCLESDMELNTKIIEDVLIFPATIYTPS
jgi:hypothetical protein